jgi:hypothetical protein
MNPSGTGGMMSGAGGFAVSPKKETQVSIELSKLESAISILDGGLKEHVQILEPILLVVPPNPSCDGEKLRPSLVPLAERIINIRSRIEQITFQLQDISRRCEI